MLAHELRGFCEPLPAGELRHIAVNTWHAILQTWLAKGCDLMDAPLCIVCGTRHGQGPHSR